MLDSERCGREQEKRGVSLAPKEVFGRYCSQKHPCNVEAEADDLHFACTCVGLNYGYLRGGESVLQTYKLTGQLWF